MPRLVLRLLMCLSLILNGSGYLMAATQMEVTHLSMNARAMAASQPPCHATNDMTVEQALPSHDGMATLDNGSSVNPHDAPSDCCQSALCTCDCLQHATADIAIAAVAGGMPPARYTVALRETRPVAPPFHAPLRPPIA